MQLADLFDKVIGQAHLPDLVQLRRQNAEADRAALSARPSLPETPISCAEVIAWALANNLDAAVAAQDASVQHEAATGARRRMLPRLMAGGDMSQRSKPEATWRKTAGESEPPCAQRSA